MVLTDCLPRLLHVVARSVYANLSSSDDESEGACKQDGVCPHTRVRVAMLDWDAEAPEAASTADVYSTEQGIKAAQLSASMSSAAGAGSLALPPSQASPSEPTEPLSGQPPPVGSVDRRATFDVVLASDVLYSLTHAAQLPHVIANHLAPGGRLVAMVPVRSTDHTSRLLGGLRELGLHVTASRVDRKWVSGVIAAQHRADGADRAKAGTSAIDATARGRGSSLCQALPMHHAAEEVDEHTQLVEGEILFVEAHAPSASI